MQIRSIEDLRKRLPAEIDNQLRYEKDPRTCTIRMISTIFSDFGKLSSAMHAVGAKYVDSSEDYQGKWLQSYTVAYSPSEEEIAEYLGLAQEGAKENMQVLLRACETFLKDLPKFGYSLSTKENFECVVYGEVLKALDSLRKEKYWIHKNEWYGTGPHPWGEPMQAYANFALGERREVAVRIGFSQKWVRPGDYDLKSIYNSLNVMRSNGAVAAYYIHLHRWDKEEDIPKRTDTFPCALSYSVSEFGLSGEWKKLPAENNTTDYFLVASVGA